MINTILAKRHKINMVLRILKQRLQVYRLKSQNVPNKALKEIMRREVQGSSSRLGYWGMWNPLCVLYQIRTPRNVVMRLLKELDPVATEQRRSSQLKRRRYKSGDLAIHLFVEGVKDFAFCSNLFGTDAGTENDVMTSIQCALREGTAAHKYGSLIADQRIGNWWSSMRRSHTGRLINFLKRKLTKGRFVTDSHLHKK